jgi:hypothetical protein
MQKRSLLFREEERIHSLEEGLRSGRIGGVIADGKNECNTDFFAEVVVEAQIPVADCSTDGTINVAVVPDEIVGNARGQSCWITKDGEEFTKLVEVIGDATAVVNCGGEVLKELANSHDALSNTD